MRFFRRTQRLAKVGPTVENEQVEASHSQELLKLERKDVKVGSFLGEGGFGQVNVVTLKRKKNKIANKDNKSLAMKQLRTGVYNMEKMEWAAKALVRECRIMKLLRGHQHILPIRAVGEMTTHKGFKDFFLVMDALPETMSMRLQRWRTTGPTPEHLKYKLQYALQMAKALAHCHENGVVYRDCKVDNFGFSDEHTVQLFDFGLARELPSKPIASSEGEPVYRMTICGTQRNMAPEVFKTACYNCKADTYSWAMTVVEMITGQKPFPRMTIPVHKVLVLEGGGRPNIEGFPSGLKAILRYSWANSLEQRWSLAQVCAHFEAFVVNEHKAVAVGATQPLPLHDQAQIKNVGAIRKIEQVPQRPLLALAA